MKTLKVAHIKKVIKKELIFSLEKSWYRKK